VILSRAEKKNVYASIYVLDPPAPHMDPSLLLAFPLCLALSTPCNACIYKMLHPQAVYRTSDVGEYRQSKCRSRSHQGIFKGPLKADEIHEIYSPPTKNACGYSIGMEYPHALCSLLGTGYLTAGRIHFTNCYLVYPWSRLSQKQGCGCHIQPCIMCEHPCPEPDVNECTWEQKDCDFRYWMEEQTISSMCFPGKSGQCKWTAIPLNGTKIIPS
uniref:Uncharacterized protein n=1 Tax=Marmota marmota marmota TaxID=9994 RepID=A0A8C5ZGL0_MARMA